MKHPIPRAALDDRLGFIGTSGSGKTYNAGTAIEILLSQRSRVVIVDPLGAWWGLRLMADGKKPSGFNVAIFGGEHGDLPLTEQAGALIGETAASMAESCIIDLSKLPSRSAERRFMVAFLETIYRKAGGEPFHLVVDEADLFAPQKPAKGDEVLLGHMDNIVRRGRMRGFIPWLISQRPAVLNKNVLSQVDGLLAFKLTASQDRDALDAWIEGQADKAQGKEIKDSLPTFPVGEGVIWLPGHGILERRPFPAKVTFDSSRKPKRGEKLKSKKLKPLDISKLKERLASIEEDKIDAKDLRKQVTELQAQLRKAAAAKPAPVDPEAIKKAEERGYERGSKAMQAEADKTVRTAQIAFLAELGTRLAPAMEFLTVEAKRLKASVLPSIQRPAFTPSAPPPATRAMPASATKPSRAPSPPPAGDGTITAAMLEPLGALAWWTAIGQSEPTKKQLAGMLGIAPGGSTMRGRLASLANNGLITYPEPGRVTLTAAGHEAAPAPDTTAGLVETIRKSLSESERETFDAIPADPATSISRSELGMNIGGGIEPGGSTMRGRLAALSNRELVIYPSNGFVSRQDWVVG